MIRKIGKSVGHMLELKRNVNSNFLKKEFKRNASVFLKKNSTTMKHISCPACNYKKSKKWSDIVGFQYVMCQNCGLIYLNPHPDSRAVLDYYTSPGYRYDSSYSPKKFDKKATEFRLKKIIYPRYKFVRQFKNIESWLDLGTGNGEMVYGIKKLSKNKIKVDGVEPSLNSVSYAKKNFNVDLINSDLLKYLKSNSLDYDVVSLFGVLEHMSNPNLVLKILSKQMKINSLLVLLLPIGICLSSLMQKAIPESITRHVYPPAHITLWGEKSISALLNKNKYEIRGIWTYGQDCFELLNHLSNNISNKEKEKLIKFMPKLQKAIDESNLSDEMLVIAKKQ